jgi:hypothetical protein
MENRSGVPNQNERERFLYRPRVGGGLIRSRSSNGVVRTLLGGWQVNTIGLMQTGIPLVIRGANNFQADRPSSTGQSAKLDSPTVQRWFNTDVFVNPPNATFGNIGRALPDLRTPRYRQFRSRAGRQKFQC